MSRENLEIVRALAEAFNRGDAEAMMAHIDPSIEWYPAADEPASGPYRGHAGIRQALEDFDTVFEDFTVEVEEEIEVEDGVIVCLKYHGRGRESGVDTEVRETHINRIRDGKVFRVDEFRTKEEALEAAGLLG
jgi:ketosteroid isomerase-like protein